MVQDRSIELHGYGFQFDEADDYAKLIINELAETGISPLLAMLALARAMVIIGGPRDMLDMACRMIDDFGELVQVEDEELAALFTPEGVDNTEEV